MSPHRHFHRLAWAAVALALCVSVFGAFVRLSDAGLGCPDWPTCYGKATWPAAEATIASAKSWDRWSVIGEALSWRPRAAGSASAWRG